MKKRLLAVLLGLSMVVSLVGCAGGSDTTEDPAPAETTEEVAAPEETEDAAEAERLFNSGKTFINFTKDQCP